MLGRAWRRAGLGARLFVAIGLVILAGAATALLVAVLVAPPVFRHHLESVGVTADSPVASHIDRGFTIALLTAVAAAVVAASAVAALVAVVVARRISRPVGTAAAAAGRLADGDYSTRVQPPAMGPELDELARSVNALAVRLESAERRRLDLMTDLAHELRTPLATLEATVEALVDGVLPLDRTTLQTLTDQTGRLTRLTHDLPAVSRIDEHAFRLDRRDADLGALVATAVSTHQARYDAAGVTLTSDAPDALATRVDPDRVLEVLDQLLDNALRHTDAGGAVTVSLRRDGDRALVRVADSGEGFDPDAAEAVFERFQRGRRSKGTGVGLTIARSLAEAHGGTLTAASPGPGRGAILTLVLPVSHPSGSR